MFDLDPVILAWCAFALFCGGAIKGTLGIGTPLLTVPMMSLVLPIHMAVTIMAVPVVVANLWQTIIAGRAAYVLKRFWPVLIAVLCGTYVGTKILSVIDQRTLLLAIGGIVISSTLLQFSQPHLRLPARLEKPAGMAFGFVSGLVGGISSMFGPPLIIYLVSLRLSKDMFVSAIGCLYLSAVVPWVAGLILFGVMDSRTLTLSAAGVVPVFTGILLGQQIRRRMSERWFRTFVLIILLAAGCTMLWRALAF